ncbi:MAG: carbohydrate binding family 9 domain-containing protein [Flavisolibacter sp.]|nr:carbohydrate binding family 9 domain-containing protein [Flavisolibacter sp.]
MKKFVVLCGLLCLLISALAQENIPPSIIIKKAVDKITVDGELNENAWKEAAVADSFFQNFPFDTSRAQMQTQARVTFDDRYLYISGVVYQPQQYIVQSLKRDFPNGSSDIFFVTIDPFQDKLNGFYFAVSPYNIQKEGLLFSGNELDIAWDNKWYSAVKNYKDRWVVEMAIPFKTLRYKIKSGTNTWNINFCRNNLLINERSTWAPVPRNFRPLEITFNGTMLWADTPPPPGTNMALIPYATGTVAKDHLKGTPADAGVQIGGDAKIGITPSLNLDITVNPDFAQVEVDRQITNLSRFELFFPERRQFFIENSDLFGAFGISSINPFFSRRIGLSRSMVNGQNVKIPIVGGVRLSGRLTENWRVGLMDMQTKASEEAGVPATNFAVAAVQRRVFTRSNIGLIFVNKNDFYHGKDTTAYNRILGADFNLASANGKWNGKLFYHQAFTPFHLPNQLATAASINYNATHLAIENTVSYIGTHYRAEVGFVPRRGLAREEGSLEVVFFPKGHWSKTINNIRIGPDWDIFYGVVDKQVTDWDAGLFGQVQFQNSALVNFALFRNDYTYLFSPFDPTNSGGVPLSAGTAYRYKSTRLGFTSNQRNKFFYQLQTRFGQYFNGRIYNAQTTFSYRWQPMGIISLNVNYNRIRLPAPYSDATLYLIGPHFDLSFSRNVFFSTFLQYNNQINNFNVNARFQWRFKPVSDFFIVYTDNYFATADSGLGAHAFQTKNRAVVAKLTYWLNL